MNAKGAKRPFIEFLASGGISTQVFGSDLEQVARISHLTVGYSGSMIPQFVIEARGIFQRDVILQFLCTYFAATLTSGNSGF